MQKKILCWIKPTTLLSVVYADLLFCFSYELVDKCERKVLGPNSHSCYSIYFTMRQEKPTQIKFLASLLVLCYKYRARVGYRAVKRRKIREGVCEKPSKTWHRSGRFQTVICIILKPIKTEQIEKMSRYDASATRRWGPRHRRSSWESLMCVHCPHSS